MDVTKSERHRELEARSNALSADEQQELEGLEASYVAALAADDPEADQGEYLPHQISQGYEPQPWTPEQAKAFEAMRRRFEKPSLWQRIKRRFGHAR